MKGKRHEDGVRAWVQSGWVSSKFTARLAFCMASREAGLAQSKAWRTVDPRSIHRSIRRGRADKARDFDLAVAEAYDAARSACRKIPDAFLLLPDTKVVVVTEFVDTHDSDPSGYVGLWTLLDDWEWELIVDIMRWDESTGAWSETRFGGDYFVRASLSEAAR